MNELRKIELPAELCRAAEERFRQLGPLEEILTAALRELVRDDAVKMDEREQLVIEERLKALGYV
ncbi:MAG TPA: hypothetical protein VJ731_14855 [Terriglobales bacterium]|nr:hypothetical protein [Terriglobales bacterium]